MKLWIFTFVAQSKVMDPNNILMLLTDLVRQDRSLLSHIDFLDLWPLTGEGGGQGGPLGADLRKIWLFRHYGGPKLMLQRYQVWIKICG